MPLITFTVPCYNSAEYMSRCIGTLVTAGNDAEIIIVDDGSEDNTPAVADEWVEKYPGIVRVIHQPNGGHGEGVNQGIRNASGEYFKVVDSDDWLDVNALQTVMETLRSFRRNGSRVDLLVCDFIYEYASDGTQKTVGYGNVFPRNKTFSWNDIRRFPFYQYLTIHSVLFRTETIRRSGLTLPKHTFYVDNIYVYTLLPYVEKIYYLNVGLYHYLIGRDGQSVNEKTMMRNIDDQLRVTDIMMHSPDITALPESQKKLKTYMTQCLGLMMSISTLFLNLDGSEAAREKKRRLWNELKAAAPIIYRNLRYRHIIGLAASSSRSLERLSIAIYRLLHHLFRFN